MIEMGHQTMFTAQTDGRFVNGHVGPILDAVQLRSPWKIRLERMIWRYHHFRKPPYT